MVQCGSCGKVLGEGENQSPIASISGSIMGDEYTEAWYYCPDCQLYALEDCRDRFCGEEDVKVRKPIDKATGDAKVALIKQCSKPWSKRCRCPAHIKYFGSWLD